MPKLCISSKSSRRYLLITNYMPHIKLDPMARLLLPVHGAADISQAGFAIGTMFLCAFALFMCTGHSRKWGNHLRACYSYSFEELPVVYIDSPGMVQGFQLESDEGSDNGSDYDMEDSVWQKNILMGRKCQLPDFSGVIIYDSEGNIVPRGTKPTLALPWK